MPVAPFGVVARGGWVSAVLIVLLAITPRAQTIQPDVEAILAHVSHELGRRPELRAAPRATSGEPWKVAVVAIEDPWDSRLGRAACQQELDAGLRADLDTLNRALGRQYFRLAAIGEHDIGLIVGNPETMDARLVKRLEGRELPFAEPGYVREDIGLGPGHHYRWHQMRSYVHRQSNQFAYAFVNRGWYPGPISPDDCRWWTTRDVVLTVSLRMERLIGSGKRILGTSQALDWGEYDAFRAAAFCAQLGLAGDDLRRCGHALAGLLYKPT